MDKLIREKVNKDLKEEFSNDQKNIDHLIKKLEQFQEIEDSDLSNQDIDDFIHTIEKLKL